LEGQDRVWGAASLTLVPCEEEQAQTPMEAEGRLSLAPQKE
jgi:hypothetical protein